MIQVSLPDVRRDEDIILFQCGYRFYPAQRQPYRTSWSADATYVSFILWMNGFSFPGRGVAFANVSIDGVNVAVNKHVCRSLGSIPNKNDSSEAKVGVKRRSASSKT